VSVPVAPLGALPPAQLPAFDQPEPGAAPPVQVKSAPAAGDDATATWQTVSASAASSARRLGKSAAQPMLPATGRRPPAGPGPVDRDASRQRRTTTGASSPAVEWRPTSAWLPNPCGRIAQTRRRLQTSRRIVGLARRHADLRLDALVSAQLAHAYKPAPVVHSDCGGPARPRAGRADAGDCPPRGPGGRAPGRTAYRVRRPAARVRIRVRETRGSTRGRVGNRARRAGRPD
jgi:hypothetical protein